MKVKLRRLHIRIDVTTERGERRDVTISHRPREGAPPVVLLRLMQWALAKAGFQLVDELEGEPVPFDDLEDATESPTADHSVAALPALPPPSHRFFGGVLIDTAPVQPSGPRVVIRDEVTARSAIVSGAHVVLPAAILPSSGASPARRAPTPGAGGPVVVVGAGGDAGAAKPRTALPDVPALPKPVSDVAPASKLGVPPLPPDESDAAPAEVKS